MAACNCAPDARVTGCYKQQCAARCARWEEDFRSLQTQCDALDFENPPRNVVSEYYMPLYKVVYDLCNYCPPRGCVWRVIKYYLTKKRALASPRAQKALQCVFGFLDRYHICYMGGEQVCYANMDMEDNVARLKEVSLENDPADADDFAN